MSHTGTFIEAQTKRTEIIIQVCSATQFFRFTSGRDVFKPFTRPPSLLCVQMRLIFPHLLGIGF